MKSDLGLEGGIHGQLVGMDHSFLADSEEDRKKKGLGGCRLFNLEMWLVGSAILSSTVPWTYQILTSISESCVFINT